MLNLLVAGLHNQGSSSPALQDSKLLHAEQLRGSQSFLATLQAHIPFLSLMNHLSLLFVQGPGFPPEAAMYTLRGRADIGHGKLPTRMPGVWSDTVYLKESEGIMVHKEVRYLKVTKTFVTINPEKCCW